MLNLKTWFDDGFPSCLQEETTEATVSFIPVERVMPMPMMTSHPAQNPGEIMDTIKTILSIKIMLEIVVLSEDWLTGGMMQEFIQRTLVRRLQRQRPLMK
jgi:hypothetical protein